MKLIAVLVVFAAASPTWAGTPYGRPNELVGVQWGDSRSKVIALTPLGLPETAHTRTIWVTAHGTASFLRLHFAADALAASELITDTQALPPGQIFARCMTAKEELSGRFGPPKSETSELHVADKSRPQKPLGPNLRDGRETLTFKWENGTDRASLQCGYDEPRASVRVMHESTAHAAAVVAQKDRDLKEEQDRVRREEEAKRQHDATTVESYEDRVAEDGYYERTPIYLDGHRGEMERIAPTTQEKEFRALKGYLKATWGMTEAQVRKVHPDAAKRDGALTRIDRIAGMKCSVLYAFINNKLVEVQITFDTSSFRGKSVDDHYLSLREVLKAKYGNFSEVEALTCPTAQWDGPETRIALGCIGRFNELQLRYATQAEDEEIDDQSGAASKL